MSGKPPVFVRGPLNSTLQELSKNQLIDLVAHIAFDEIEDVGGSNNKAGDIKILNWIQDRMNTVWLFRKDNRRKLVKRYEKYVESDRIYQENLGTP